MVHTVKRNLRNEQKYKSNKRIQIKLISLHVKTLYNSITTIRGISYQGELYVKKKIIKLANLFYS